jgi:hypothetical protein
MKTQGIFPSIFPLSFTIIVSILIFFLLFLLYSSDLANIDVYRHILVVDTSVLVKSNMGRREYLYIVLYYDVLSISVVINKPLYIEMLLNFLTCKSQFRPWLPVALSWDCTNDLSLKCIKMQNFYVLY